MLDEIEKSFIKCFVVKSKQDRLLFELGGKKHSACDANVDILKQHPNYDESWIKD